MRRLAAAAVLACAAGVAGACGDDPGTAPPAGSLPALLRDLAVANGHGDAARVREITLAVIPTSDDLRTVLRPGPEADAFVARYEPKDVRPDDPKLDALAFVGSTERSRTEVFVHSATTEDLARRERGTVASREFEEGMQAFARRIAAPGKTWWSAELRQPGQGKGTRFTCFTRVGDRWVLIVRPWLSLPDDGPSAGR